MAIAAKATEHPLALADGMSISHTGSLPHVYALGELIGVLDSFFDGPGNPPYAGSTTTVDQAFYEHAPDGFFRVFWRAFWGSGSAGVLAAVYLVNNVRPVLMAVMPIGLRHSAPALTLAEAEAAALATAAQRAPDL